MTALGSSLVVSLRRSAGSIRSSRHCPDLSRARSCSMLASYFGDCIWRECGDITEGHIQSTTMSARRHPSNAKSHPADMSSTPRHHRRPSQPTPHAMTSIHSMRASSCTSPSSATMFWDATRNQLPRRRHRQGTGRHRKHNTESDRSAPAQTDTRGKHLRRGAHGGRTTRTCAPPLVSPNQ